MITKTGQNLSVLIITETGKDWQTFATWYSIYKNLPDAKTAIISHRTGDTPYMLLQWTKRLNVPTIHRWPFTKGDTTNETVNWLDAINMAHKEKMVGEEVLIVKPLTMALSDLDQKTLLTLNKFNLLVNEAMWFMRNQNYNKLIDKCFLEDAEFEVSSEKLYVEAKETDEPACLVSYKKGCGKWIDTAKGCPFSSAGGLVTLTMTANEHKVISLWEKMVSLYNAVV
jgi:hypothetical protein